MKALHVAALLTLALPNVGLAKSQTCDFNVTVDFVQGAPVDRFIISNTSQAAIDVAEIELDLRQSVAKSIFDTQSGGVGVEVFQPFQSDDTAHRCYRWCWDKFAFPALKCKEPLLRSLMGRRAIQLRLMGEIRRSLKRAAMKRLNQTFQQPDQAA